MGVAPRKLGGISLGGNQTTRMQSAAMFEWSDDDGAPIAPPPSTKAPLRSSCMEVQLKGGENVPEQQVTRILEQQAMGIPEPQTTGVLERQEKM